MAILLLFDIDGTLLNSAGSGRRSLKESINSVTGMNCENAVNFSFMGKTDRFIIQSILKNLNVSNSEILIKNIKQEYFKKLRYNIENNHKKAQILGIEKFLRIINSKTGIKVGLQTGNFRQGAFIKLQSLKLDAFFRVGGFGDACTERVDVIRHALDESASFFNMDFSPDEIIVIGDTPADIYAGKAFNTRTIAVCSNPGMHKGLVESKPDLLIEDFRNHDHLLGFINNGTKFIN